MNTINHNDNIDFIAFELKTGRIILKMNCPAYAYAANAQPLTGVSYLKKFVTDCDNFYVLNGEVIERPRLNLSGDVLHLKADGVDSISFNDIPPGSTVTLDNQIYDLNDGTFKFTTEKQGHYVLKFDAFPFLDEIIEIEAI